MARTFAGPINWFPGHMARAVRHIEERITKCDAVVELRDARIPFSSSNSALDALLRRHGVRRLVVFNKADLANSRMQQAVRPRVEAGGDMCVFMSATKRTNVAECVKALSVLAPVKFAAAGAMALVVGIPNVGKSSFINAVRAYAGRALRAGNVAKAGAKPGLTRNISAIKVCTSPTVYLVDTPGVMVPRVSKVEVGLKLGLVGCLRDAVVPDVVLAEFLLEMLNARRATAYVKLFALPGATANIGTVLDAVAVQCGRKHTGDEWHHESAARHFVRMFRDGELGCVTLDDVDDDAGPGAEIAPELHE